MRDNEGVLVRDAPICPLCGGAGVIAYADLRDRYWDAPGTWTFRRCATCGHLWLDPQPEASEIGKLYRSYFSHGAASPLPFVGDDLWAQATRGVLEILGYKGASHRERERWLGSLFRLVPPIWEECEQPVRSVRGPPRGVLLDLGCGNGSYMDIMRSLGWRVQGLEPDPIAASIARDRGFEVIESPIEAAPLPAGGFDYITMSHVIEHVVDPVRVLTVARQALKEDGRLTILTPNAESWGHRKFREAWFHLDPPRHLHLFSTKNLIACAQRAGLRVASSVTTGRGHLVYDGSVAIRATGRYRFGDPSTVASMRDRAFRAFESFLTRVRPDAGEETILTCTR